MAIAFESIQSTAYTTSGTLTVTKPVSLAVGDLMIAYVSGQQYSGGTTPTGFTEIKKYEAGGGGVQMRVYYKIATSDDVAASNFSWTNGGEPIGGAIMRITGQHSTTPAAVFSFDDETSTATPSFTSTLTPTNVDSLIIFFLGTFINTATTRTASGYAIATSNPSWTERLDQTLNTGSGGLQMSIATASRPESSATGNASVTMSGSCTDLGNIMLVIRPKFSSTISETPSVTDIFVKSVNRIFTETPSVSDDLTTTKQKDWNNTDKNSSSWINEDKH